MKNLDDIIYFTNTFQYTKGIKRGILIDSINVNYYFVPLDLINFVKNGKWKNLKEIRILYKNNLKIIYEYISYLKSIDALVWISPSQKSNFNFNQKFENTVPNKYSNAIIDLNENSNYNLEKSIYFFNSIGVMYVQFRLFNFINLYDKILEIISYISTSNFWGVEIVIASSRLDENIYNILSNEIRITNVFVSNSIYKFVENAKFILLDNIIQNCTNCGNISKSNFNTNFSFLSESKNFNSCLFKKISIDTLGNLKNCPSMAKSFGNINDENLNIETIVDSEEFQEVWHISKDKINICKVCEFRHVCTDCRAYVEDPEDIYSKPLKCGYNPYTCEWEEWSTHPMKQKAIDYYDMRAIL